MRVLGIDPGLAAFGHGVVEVNGPDGDALTACGPRKKDVHMDALRMEGLHDLTADLLS
jgi:Holliday junction resolvasome RuvABC endonuclease subunit